MASGLAAEQHLSVAGTDDRGSEAVTHGFVGVTVLFPIEKTGEVGFQQRTRETGIRQGEVSQNENRAVEEAGVLFKASIPVPFDLIFLGIREGPSL